jgi:hypothetical protein
MRESLQRGQFIELCDSPAEEIAYGIVGQFWRPSGGRKAINSPKQFVAFAQLGYAKAAWNFSFLSSSPRLTNLRTETRIRIYGRSAYWNFRVYWLLVAPFSGLLRRAILRDVKQRAERIHDEAHTSA